MTSMTAKDGMQICYQDRGTGQPVVLSLGWPLSADSWEGQMGFLASNGCRYVVHDRRGHSQSNQPWTGNDMDTCADGRSEFINKLDLTGAVPVGSSVGGGEVARHIGRHGTDRLPKAAPISTIPPLLPETAVNPGGLPIEVFESVRIDSIPDRAQLHEDLASGPFFVANKHGAKVTWSMIDSFWLQGMQAGHKDTFDSIEAFSETDFTGGLRKLDAPTPIVHGDEDQIVPIGAAALRASKPVRNATLKICTGASHTLADTRKDQLHGDLLDFPKT